ncbi:amino acid-binding protein [Ktedonobacter sp. SOSP1-85]|uniref:ACT domain-containing protein n=1 Tax=Ktedonobacter sp. SOSP1-85 TaxID=2778367 RepID=UPI0019151CE1|nr:ACT domain-containing protein [Ktedonobacter sp. SOSP1-85]GHO77418.1 amino acid-binding protein [Ktedonobacter sp. SOSP1-85]
MQLVILAIPLSVCRLDPRQEIPAWALSRREFLAITYTRQELSIVCVSEVVPEEVQVEHGWRALQVEGPLDFSLTGILAGLATPLSGAGISIFAISTYDTDYLLVKEVHLDRARKVLEALGYTFLN